MNGCHGDYTVAGPYMTALLWLPKHNENASLQYYYTCFHFAGAITET